MFYSDSSDGGFVRRSVQRGKDEYSKCICWKDLFEPPGACHSLMHIS